MSRSSQTDPALTQLLARARAGGLWVAGEQAADVVPPVALQGLTNRVDVARALQARGLACELSDFDFTPWGKTGLQAVYYRVSKEKALVHHVINQALRHLRPEGELWLSGYRQEGLKTYLDKAAAGGEKWQGKSDGGVLLGCIRRGCEPAPELPDQDYSQLREVQLSDDLSVLSKPGVFGWNKIDAGSRLLIEQLRLHASELWSGEPGRVVDLGCGYGYLSLMAARLWPGAWFSASDNNLAAVAACAANFRRAGLSGEVVAADCGDRLDGRFAAVLCNPPFHRGFEMPGDLGERFVRRARDLLDPKGVALFVVNQFLPLERLAAPWFPRVEELARNRGFKVLALFPPARG